jgi:lipopolysaccharide export system permease protein
LIISRYVTREIAWPFLVIVGLYCLIFVSYTTAVLLNEVAAGMLSATTVAKLVLIRLVIALEVLLPASLYFAVIFGLGRLHSDGEIIALMACGIGEMRLVAIVLRLSLVVAVAVACVSLVARPWAYQQRYLLLAEAEAAVQFDLDDLEQKHFHVGPGSNYAVFAETVDHESRTAGAVIVQIRKADAINVIVAERLAQPPGSAGPLTLLFGGGFLYQLDREGSRDVVGKFKELRLTLSEPEPELVGYKSKAESTLSLSGSSQPKDLAEFQWRLSTPVATFLIALLAVPLSRSGPRRGRFAKILVAVIAYAVFYNLMTFAKNLVQEGLAGAVPGLWWPLVPLALLLSLWFWRGSRVAHP